jgi:hypothetical protein
LLLCQQSDAGLRKTLNIAVPLELVEAIEEIQNNDEIVHGKCEEIVECFNVRSVPCQFGELLKNHQLGVFTLRFSKGNQLEEIICQVKRCVSLNIS